MRTIQKLWNRTDFFLTLQSPGGSTPPRIPPGAQVTLGGGTPIPNVIDAAHFDAKNCLQISAYPSDAATGAVWHALVARTESYQDLIYAALGGNQHSFAFTRIIEAWPLPSEARPKAVRLTLRGRQHTAADLHIVAEAPPAGDPPPYDGGDGGDCGGCGGGGGDGGR